MLKRGDCSSHGINPKAVCEFIETVEKEQYGIDSFMLIKDGVVVSEGYHAPYTSSGAHIMYSLSKSITAIALGFAVCEGLVNINKPVCEYFPEYKAKGWNRDILVYHLADMTSGKYIGMASKRKNRDWIKMFFDAPFISRPGKRFYYLNDNFYMISAIISVASGETLVDFLYPRLFKPLGIKKPMWETDAKGYAAGGWGLYLSIEDLAKIMLCCSYNGKWQGKQIIPLQWIKQSTVFRTGTVKHGHADGTKGYGFGFWQTSIPDTYRAYGLCGQFGYVFKNKNTVLVINSGISRDEIITDAVNKMTESLWDEPQRDYEEKLSELTASLGDKDKLAPERRNAELENKYNGVELKTHSNSFGSMLHATVSAVMDQAVGKSTGFSLSLNDNELFLSWREGNSYNTIPLGMDNIYKKSIIQLGDLKYNVASKAAWTDEKKLTVFVRIVESAHVRRLIFDFSDEKHIKIQNDSFPDMPVLAAHYLDFSGLPLPKPLEKILINVVIPGVLLIGEPNYKIKIEKY